MEKSVYRSLLGERSTPFYVFDTQGFIENYQALQAAMQQVYPNYRVAYSYKTNYTPYICNLVKSLGGYAEVVSDMEYRLAKKLGYENSRIVYNGPAKGSCMEEHLRSGGISNVDNPAEAARVAQLAAACPECTIRIGLRINMDLGFVSRFGMSVQELNRVLMYQLEKNFEEYLNSVRVNRACELLISTDASVMDIALEVGYHNAKTLTRNFVKHKLMTPQSFRTAATER